MVEIIYAQHALKGTEPDWGAMGASDIGFAAGMCKQVGEQVKNVIEFPFVLVDGLFIKLPIALVHGLVQLAEDPQGTVEGLVEKIKVLPAYIEQVPAEFKAYIDEISAIEDPYQQGEALGQLMGDALPTGAVVGGVMGKVVGKVGKWKATKAAKAGPRGVQTLQQVLPNTEAFFKSADTCWKNGAQGSLSVAGRALQKHAGRGESAFSSIKFSGKTANQDAMKIIKEIMRAPNKRVVPQLNGTTVIYNLSSGRGFNISRKGLFNGFRNMKKE